MNAKNLNKKIDEIFKQVGEFGPYQCTLFFLIGITAFVPAIVGYSYSFYGATPEFRCKLPIIANDSFEIIDEWHQSEINKYIPLAKEKSINNPYEKCYIKIFNSNDTLNANNNFTLEKCDSWVYSKKYFNSTLITDWNLVCDHTSKKTLFSTLYFVGTYGVLLNGFLSDRLGRKIAAYIFILANAVINTLLTILIYFKPFDLETQQITFAILRFLGGIASNVYSVCVVLAIEICGPSWRVTAANSIYYLYIFGEFIVVLFAYFINDYKVLYATYTILMTSFIFFFWLVPESPRWLLTKNRYHEAYKVFRRIAKSNKKSFENFNELEELNSTKKHQDTNKQLNENETMITTAAETTTTNEDNKQPQTFSIIATLKIFFKSKKLMIRSTVILLNWLTNTLVYYGISFNTSALSGDPYLNFALSVFVELIAIVSCQFTLERFGRKFPYAINMAITGVSLLLIQFVPQNMPYMVTILALIGKFSISFTYNSVYIITSEIHPTVIRNSSVSLCQAFARMGAIIAPSIQLMGELYWYPLPFIIFGFFSMVSATLFVIFMPETKNTKLPDTIEEFLKE